MKIDNEKCKSCGMCVEVCDAEAISPAPRKSGGYAGYQINQDLCVNCGSCVDVCPGDAVGE